MQEFSPHKHHRLLLGCQYTLHLLNLLIPHHKPTPHKIIHNSNRDTHLRGIPPLHLDSPLRMEVDTLDLTRMDNLYNNKGELHLRLLHLYGWVFSSIFPLYGLLKGEASIYDIMSSATGCRSKRLQHDHDIILLIPKIITPSSSLVDTPIPLKQAQHQSKH
jgi:hypothetical protein